MSRGKLAAGIFRSSDPQPCDALAFHNGVNILRRMRIAINHTRFKNQGGIELHIVQLVERLLADGHEVHCFVRRWTPHDHPRLRFHHVPVLPLGEGVKALTFAYASFLKISRERFDVVHGFSKTFEQTVYTDGSGSFSDYRRYLGSASLWRRITTFRPLLAFATWHIERRRFRRTPPPRVLAMSADTREQILRRHRFPAERISVAYSGVDTQRFQPGTSSVLREAVRARLGTPENRLALLCVGNDFRRKGFDTAIKAMTLLPKASCVLWMLGQDRHSPRYERLAARLEVEARFLGSRADPTELFAGADAFLFPSRFDVFGNAALEALACGLPAILSRKAGVSELVEDGHDGLLLRDPESPLALAQLVRRIFDPELRRKLAMNARETAKKYSFEAYYRRVLEAYHTAQAADAKTT